MWWNIFVLFSGCLCKNLVAISRKERYYGYVFNHCFIVQTLSSQSTISSLPLPQKSATFFKNPLDRPEIGPSENHPLVSSQPTIPANSSWKKPLPPLWKPEKQTEAQQTARVQSPIVTQNKNTPTETSTRRRLPDEIKKIFETNSRDFAVYAKNDKKNSGEARDTAPSIMDAWDRALLLGEDLSSIAAVPHTPPKRLSFASTPSSLVPQKTDTYKSRAAFPSRVMDEGVASPVLHKEFLTTARTPQTPIMPLGEIRPVSPAPIIPKKPQNTLKNTPNHPPTPPLSDIVSKKTTAPLTPPTIPLKPKDPTVSILPSGNPPPSPIPPQKPEQIVPQTHVNQITKNLPTGPATRPATPAPNMSETLVEKIIEGQMRGVFNNAPPLLQKKLEKATMQEIFAVTGENAPRETIENEVWRKRLREYLAKLHEQAVSVFPDANTANPTEGELVLDYVKRVYPILLKAQVTKQ